jgi:hypothetical protein
VEATGVGLGAVGIGGFAGGPGLAATGGPGFGFTATGGGGLSASTLEGLEFASKSLAPVEGALFQGVVDPFEGAIPGNTETGLAVALAVTDCTTTFGPADGVGFGAGAAGIGRRPCGGGGAAGALCFGGTSSR